VKLYPASSVDNCAYVLVSISPVPFVVLSSVASWTAIGIAVGAEQHVHVDDILAEGDAVLIRVGRILGEQSIAAMGDVQWTSDPEDVGIWRDRVRFGGR
jgi:hypothetical protein